MRMWIKVEVTAQGMLGRRRRANPSNEEESSCHHDDSGKASRAMNVVSVANSTHSQGFHQSSLFARSLQQPDDSVAVSAPRTTTLNKCEVSVSKYLQEIAHALPPKEWPGCLTKDRCGTLNSTLTSFRAIASNPCGNSEILRIFMIPKSDCSRYPCPTRENANKLKFRICSC